MSKFRFVRKNGKVLGPLTTDRIDHLFSQGKLAKDDELGENQEGPWVSVATLQERIEQIKKKKQAKAEERRASLRSDPSEVPAMPYVNEPAHPPEAADSSDPPAGLPDLPDPLAPVSPFDPVASTIPPAHAAVSTSSRGPARTKARSPDRRGEELDATDPLRWIFPWKWETDTQPYPMLVVYLKFSRAVLTLFYLLFMLLGFVYLAFMGVGALRTAGNATSQLPLIATLISIPVFAVFWWLAAQLVYIAGMASIDVLRCFLSIERNTRQ